MYQFFDFEFSFLGWFPLSLFVKVYQIFNVVIVNQAILSFVMRVLLDEAFHCGLVILKLVNCKFHPVVVVSPEHPPDEVILPILIQYVSVGIKAALKDQRFRKSML